MAFHGLLVHAEEVAKLPFTPLGLDGELHNEFVSRHGRRYLDALHRQEEGVSRLMAALETALPEPVAAVRPVSYAVNVIRADHSELFTQLAGYDVQAVVLTLYHSGTANTEEAPQSVAALVETLRGRVIFFAVTENGEPVDLRSYKTSVRLREAGVVPLYDMPREVALAKLRLLDVRLTRVQLIDEMLHSEVGELDERRIIPEDISALKELYTSHI